jgi:hypothetical protein
VRRIDPNIAEKPHLEDILRQLHNHAEAAGRPDALPTIDRAWADYQK